MTPPVSYTLVEAIVRPTLSGCTATVGNLVSNVMDKLVSSTV